MILRWQKFIVVTKISLMLMLFIYISELGMFFSRFKKDCVADEIIVKNYEKWWPYQLNVIVM